MREVITLITIWQQADGCIATTRRCGNLPRSALEKRSARSPLFQPLPLEDGQWNLSVRLTNTPDFSRNANGMYLRRNHFAALLVARQLCEPRASRLPSSIWRYKARHCFGVKISSRKFRVIEEKKPIRTNCEWWPGINSFANWIVVACRARWQATQLLCRPLLGEMARLKDRFPKLVAKERRSATSRPSHSSYWKHANSRPRCHHSQERAVGATFPLQRSLGRKVARVRALRVR